MLKSAIEEGIHRAGAENRCALIPFLTAGFPDVATCVEILIALEANGADVIEVGLPFSDPLADGPTIQTAGKRALELGITSGRVFGIVSEAKRKITCPVVLMTYLNPVLRMGFDTFAMRAVDAGVAGVIIPDLPPEEADEWLAAAAKQVLDTIFMVAPTTPPDRMEFVASKTSGFLYYVSMTGVTGSAFSITDEMLGHIGSARNVSPVPVAVGFGISTAEHARTLASSADGIIVGSALIREIQQQQSAAGQVEAVSRLTASLSAALRHPSGTRLASSKAAGGSSS